MRRKLQHLPSIYIVIFSASSLVICFINYVLIRNSEYRMPCICPKCKSYLPVKYKSVEEMTFITVPRPFIKEDQYDRFKLAFSSWLAASPKTKIILFVNRSMFDPSDKLPKELEETFGKDRITYAGNVRHDLEEVPYIDDWFIQGVKKSQSKYVSFINSDIVLSHNWLERTKQVFRVLRNSNPVLIGQRIDFDLDDFLYENLRFDQNHLLKDIDDMIIKSSHTDHSPLGIDSFTFEIDNLPFNPEKIPPFIMGRYNWDNWIIGWLNKICDTVTFHLDPPIYHINHKRHKFDINNSRVLVNHHTKLSNKDYFGSNIDTKYEVLHGKLHERGTNNYLTLY